MKAGVALALLMSGAANGETRKDQLIFFATQARVEIDAQGHVGTVTPDPTLSPAIAQAIRDIVGGWQFAPPARDGKVASGVTYLQLSACAAPVDGKYRFAVELFGSGPARTGPAGPRLPSRVMRAGRPVSLKLNYRVLPDGTVQIDDIVFVEGVNRADQSALRESLKSWFRASKFEPEQLDGRPVATRMSLPIDIEFVQRTIVDSELSARLAAQAEGEKQLQARALEAPSCKTAMEANRNKDRQVALDSPFKLAPGS
jgi:hypothetical protein